MSEARPRVESFCRGHRRTSTAMASLYLSATKIVPHLSLRISEVRNEVLQSSGLRRHRRRSSVDASSYSGAAVDLGASSKCGQWGELRVAEQPAPANRGHFCEFPRAVQRTVWPWYVSLSECAGNAITVGHHVVGFTK
jgi:hypothetical protein